MDHKFKEYRFDPDGEINGFRCAVQEYKCEHCKVIIELPMGVNPKDYSQTDCKEANNGQTNNKTVLRMQGSDGLHGSDGHTGNRHEVRRLRSDARMRSEEKS